MKILHVLYSGLGGHGNVFFSLVDADQEREFEYEALFYGIEDVRAEYIAKCNSKNIPWYFAKKNFKIDINYYKHIWKYIYKSKPDVVFLHGSEYIVLVKIYKLFFGHRCQIVVRETQSNHLKTLYQKICLFFSLILANKIVFLTEQFMQQVQHKWHWAFRSSKAVIISNGIDLELYKPGNKSKSSTILIGMQSRLIKIKDHSTLLKAFAILKNANPTLGVRLVIAGDGDCKDVLIEEAVTLGVEKDVEFTGMLAERELVLFLQSLTIYVHASYGETMSTAIMQAMACGLPIIASDVNGINNMITDAVTGILVPVQNPQKLCDALTLYLKDPEKRTKIAMNSYEAALKEYSNNVMFEKYKTIFPRNN